MASPKILPVQRPRICSSRVAHTRIAGNIPRAASSSSIALAASFASGSNVPLTIAIVWPSPACQATLRSASPKNVAAGFSPHFPNWSTATPRKYILFPCQIALAPRGASRTASASHRQWFFVAMACRYRNIRKNLCSNDGNAVKVPSKSKNAAMFRPCSFTSFASSTSLSFTLPPAPLSSYCAPALRFQRSTSTLRSERAIPAAGRMRPSSTSASVRPCESSSAHAR